MDFPLLIIRVFKRFFKCTIDKQGYGQTLKFGNVPSAFLFSEWLEAAEAEKQQKRYEKTWTSGIKFGIVPQNSSIPFHQEFIDTVNDFL